MKKLLIFGSDRVTKLTLQSLLKSGKNKYSIEVICPPLQKPRTPLSELHEYLQQEKIPIKYQFKHFNDKE
jgi:hypothetical protein